MSEPKFPKKLNACLNAILAEEWGFLDNPWPLYPTTRKFHRSELKPINNMHHMKEEVIETCMYVYLDAFMDIHRANSPPDFGETWCPHIIYSMLEKVYKGIRRELSEKGLLTNEAAGEYLMRTEPKAT
ncbi:hypothetical protein BKA57DRAFT_537712 [Linnemannia elongata]|nr:hypothetical protein BKA57DRAFT_537712 [Linnemannia elongata]